MATIKDIADKLGISPSTVSKGLNGANDISDEMRQLVLDTAVEIGYASKRMRAHRKRKFCILIKDMDYETSDQFAFDIILGFKKAALRRECDVDIIPVDNNLETSEKYDSYVFKNNYDGAFMLGFTLHDEWTKQLHTTIIPTVLFDNHIDDNVHVASVGTDSYEGITCAVNHLVNLGHKKIAFLNGARNSKVSIDRQKAFEDSLLANGIAPDPNLMRYGYFIADCARDHVPTFIENGATAIMCASDLIASGVVNELKRLNIKVPEDISVIGFDDIPIAERLTPSLTTIRQDRQDLGKSAFLLVDGLTNDVTISKILLRAKFIERESTCKVK
ncbi:MAG: LacI family transcriptional regulator [Lachnospiraceae bacterium]|nr:LacI family transcriptional regulator [Lachnospiraceae bacterium]